MNAILHFRAIGRPPKLDCPRAARCLMAAANLMFRN
jgi:hypothetical protein